MPTDIWDVARQYIRYVELEMLVLVRTTKRFGFVRARTVVERFERYALMTSCDATMRIQTEISFIFHIYHSRLHRTECPVTSPGDGDHDIAL